MTINLGQGANCAIEDAAVLTNLLNNSLAATKEAKPSDQEVDALLRQFNKRHLERATHIYGLSRLVTRAHARDGFLLSLVGRYVLPYFDERFQSRPFKMIAAAAALDFLPLPRRSFPGWEKYRNSEARTWPWIMIPAFFLFLYILMPRGHTH